MKYIFNKVCKCCNTTFYSKEISKEVFENALDTLEYSHEFDLDVVTMHSVCGDCANDYYKEK